MLELKSIKKDYVTGETVVSALKGIDLTFRKTEFVSILGQSGCGKTTMLNIIGGLDKYSSGDLIIRGQSTKNYKDSNWDAYRNNDVGFVFQSYNLIPHQTVLGNVELALTLSGVSKQTRREMATNALVKVGLTDHINKKPNQLSGGQMQRVAIARAIVNNPTIILADEPTGALDTNTSVQIMDLLKEIAEDRLVIMVTHNPELADKYSTRIISLSDGQVVKDSNPYTMTDDERKVMVEENQNNLNAISVEKKVYTLDPELKGEEKANALKEIKDKKKADKKFNKERKASLKKTSMSATTALSLSGKNLLTKKGRTFIISLAASIGIIGVALVLAISNGFSGYINNLQAETLSSIPLTVQQQYIDLESLMSSTPSDSQSESFPDSSDFEVYEKEDTFEKSIHLNKITQDLVDHLDGFDRSKVVDIQYSYFIEYNMYTMQNDNLKSIDTSLSSSFISNGAADGIFQEFLGNDDFIKSQYDVIAGTYPQANNSDYEEIAVIVDKYNTVELTTMSAMGFGLVEGTYSLSDLLGKQYVILHNDSYYESYQVGGNTFYRAKSNDELLVAYKDALANPNGKDLILQVAGVLRLSPNAATDLYSTGLMHRKETTAKIIDLNKDSEVVKAQENENEENGGNALVLTPESKYMKSLTNSFEDYAKEDGVITTNPDYISMGCIDETIGSYTYAELTALSSYTSGAELSSTLSTLIFCRMLADSDFDFDEFAKDMDEQSLYNCNLLVSALYNLKLDIAITTAGSSLPSIIYIYPLDFDTKDEFTAYMEEYNVGKAEADQIYYSDSLSILANTMGMLVSTISIVLIAFAAVSLVVSSIMIAIITYVSVIERTKEIGVLRSIGARKKDISSVFNAETIIIGFVAGVLGVAISFVLTFPINAIIGAVLASQGTTMSVGNLASLSPTHGIALILISTVLTLISGLIPSRMASNKDPVVALRSE